MTRGRYNETTRCQEGDTSRGDATTSRSDERMSGWRNERTRTGKRQWDHKLARREDDDERTSG